jgi:septation ring formation regulator EzrA
MVDIPLVRLREIGYADLHRNQERLKKTAAAIDGKKSTLEVLADVRKDHPASGQLLQSFRDTLAGLRQFIEQRHIVTIPSKLEPVVEETPPFARALTTAAMETPGAFETKAPGGIFQVTLPDPSWKANQINQYMRV